jgi:DNA-binding NarL/FixJ family response regulator
LDPVNVTIVAASDDTRRKVALAIRAAGNGLGVTREVARVEELLEVDTSPMVLIVDGSEHDEIRAARRAFPEAALVAVVPERNRKRLRMALAEGADGIVVRERLECLPATIHAAHVGQVAVPRDLRTALVKPSLSVREKQVLGMVVMGFTNGEIARKLVLAESTIKSHLSSSFAKLGVRSRGEAAELILDPVNGLGPGILSIADPEDQLGPELSLEEAKPLARR